MLQKTPRRHGGRLFSYRIPCCLRVIPPGFFRYILFLPVSSLFFTACDSSLGRDAYVQWIRNYDNKLHAAVSQAGYVFDVQYQPSEYMLLQRGAGRLSDAERVQELEKISGMQYYTLTLSAEDKTDLIDYQSSNADEKQQRLYYLSYRMQDDITLEENSAVLPCILYHFERPVGRDRGRTMVLGFEKRDSTSAGAELVIRSALFGANPVKIRISKSNIPHVNL